MQFSEYLCGRGVAELMTDLMILDLRNWVSQSYDICLT